VLIDEKYSLTLQDEFHGSGRVVVATGQRNCIFISKYLLISEAEIAFAVIA
jgi:hypothetical protein